MTIRGECAADGAEAASWDRAYVVRLVALFCGGWAAIYVDRTALYPLLKVVADEFVLTGSLSGGFYLSAAVVMVGFALSLVPAGRPARQGA